VDGLFRSVAQDVNKQAVRAIANVGLVMGKGVAIVDPFLVVNAAWIKKEWQFGCHSFLVGGMGHLGY
jgi:hypothetical protein